ncbi:MAG: hypothetical protein ACOX7J_04375 [Bacillota bacterium]
MKKYLCLFEVCLLCLVISFALTGCGSDEPDLNLSELETVQYNNPHNGASVTVPADWEIISEDENGTVFSDADGTISFVLKWELGGMSYFSKEELAGLAVDVAKATLKDAAVYESLELTKFDVAVKGVCTGTVADDAENSVNAVCDTAIIQYFHDVRYYLVAVTDAGTYAEYENVFTQIANSFTCSLSEDEVYEKINEQAAAMAEEAAKESIKAEE